jgi:hypothetical protein
MQELLLHHSLKPISDEENLAISIEGTILNNIRDQSNIQSFDILLQLRYCMWGPAADCSRLNVMHAWLTESRKTWLFNFNNNKIEFSHLI